MSMAVFWIETGKSELFPNMSYPMVRVFGETELQQALAFAGEQRARAGISHVCIHSEPEDCVSEFGASIVQDGKLPGGEDYTWKKRR